METRWDSSAVGKLETEKKLTEDKDGQGCDEDERRRGDEG